MHDSTGHVVYEVIYNAFEHSLSKVVSHAAGKRESASHACSERKCANEEATLYLPVVLVFS